MKKLSNGSSTIPVGGIGDSTVDKIREIAGKYHVSLWTVLCNLDKVAGAFNSGTLSKLQKFGSLIERFREQIANENAYDASCYHRPFFRYHRRPFQ